MFGYCCKCNDENAGYSGRSGSGNSGGGLYLNPYGVGGGCPICSTVPYAISATVVMEATCPCMDIDGVFELQHQAGTTYGVDFYTLLPVTGVACDCWSSAEKAVDDITCVASIEVPRVEVVLYNYLGNYNWRMAVHYMNGPFIREAYHDTGYASCFQNLSSTTFTYIAFPCIVTSMDAVPA